MHLIEPEYEGQLIHLDTHVSGEFFFSESTARGNRYGVGGIPHVQFDGRTQVVGAGSCNSAANAFRAQMNSRIAATSGVTPIEASVEMTIEGGQVTVTGTAELVDNIALSGLQMTLFIVEDGLSWCCDPQGGDYFDGVTRGIKSSPVTLTFGGGEVQSQESWAMNSEWNADNMWAVAVVEYVGGTREIFQSAEFRNDLSVALDQVIASVPSGSGEVLVTGTITNGNALADIFDLTITGDQGGWSQEFQLDGDPNWYTTTTLALDPAEAKGVTIRVNTDASEVVGFSNLNATGQTTFFSSNGGLRTFNGTQAVLFVDADKNNPRQMHLPFTEGLDAIFPFYDTIVGNGPRPDAVAGYDLIVWETGFVSNDAISASGGEALEAHLAAGGNLLLSSMGFSTSPANTASLRTALGVASFNNDTGALEENGVNGDPVTDGMFYVMDWLNPAYNKCDTVTPISSGGGTSAATIFRNENGNSNAIRQETDSGQRTILNTIWAEGFGEDDDYDDEVIAAMLTWLAESQDPASVGDAPFVSSLMSASPNPFSPRADIQFALSDWAAQQNVELKVVDATGRLVRNLYAGQLDSGAHSMAWDGLDDAGHEAANGLYFGVLDSADGIMKTKLIRLR